MSTTKKITIIIVTYNSAKHVNKLLQSIKRTTNPALISQIIIIDNHSKDVQEIRTDFEQNIRLIRNNENVGFAKAVNQGIRSSNSKYVLLLNPDTELVDDSISILLNKMESNNRIGMIGGKILKKKDNSVQFTATRNPDFLTGLFEFTILKKIFPNNAFHRNFWVESIGDIKKDTKVTSLCGAFLLFKRILDNKLTLLNEKYFLYLEDLDLGIEISKKYDVMFCPSASIKHVSGASSNSKYGIVLSHWYKSRKIFFLKQKGLILGGLLWAIFNIEENLLKMYHFIKNEPAN